MPTLPGLPTRPGPRPLVTGHAPQVQLDQFPPVSLRPGLLRQLRQLAGVSFAPSHRAPPGTIGLHLCGCGRNAPRGAFMIGEEFAHVHPDDDASMHLVLPEPLRSEAIRQGWAEPHPLAGQPTVPEGIVLLYAPRTEAELRIVVDLVGASWRHARSGSRDNE